MSTTEQIQIFADARIRTAWDDKAEKWYFSIVDVVAVLTDSQDYQQARNYWKVLKNRMRQEGNQSVTKCNQLKLASPEDGKRYLTDVADQEQLFRLIQSIPSKKAEPIKLWIAKVASDGKRRLTDVADQEQLFRLIQSIPSKTGRGPQAQRSGRAFLRVAPVQG